MPITIFAAIDVGSNELSMKIFEVSKKNGIKELEFIRHTIELGSETYTNGKISHVLVDEMCQVLLAFTKKMKEYQVTDYTACATSAIRESFNSLLILDQIELSSGLKVKILSNSEQRFLCYKAIALKENDFNKIIKKGTVIVDVGAGSIQISLFNKEALVTTQNIKLGSLRIREILADMENQTTNFNNLISEYIDNDLKTFHELFLKDNKIRNIIAVGDGLSDILKYATLKSVFVSTTAEKPLDSTPDFNIDYVGRIIFINLYQSLLSKSVGEISSTLGISKEQAALILPTAMIYYKMFEETKAEFMWFPGITLCDGLVAEYAEKKEKIIPSHPFTNDIVIAARNIASRYQCNLSHTNNVEYIALTVFDSIRKFHGFGKRERLLLQIATILHDCGEYINMNAVGENSYNIIMSTEIIGLSHTEREIVANLVRYNSSDFPKYLEFVGGFDKDTYIMICKLAAILRIANAMDKSHRQKFSNLIITRKDKELILTTETLEDITLEKGLFEKKADFFEEVYGIRPILKQKRSI